MDYTIAAIPTRYNGTRFRSRLEARWAAFFDLCGWRWDYEPFDLEGWIPDFVIEGHKPNGAVSPFLIEIKPVQGDEDQVLRDTQEKAERSIKASGGSFECLIGSYFFPRIDGYPCLGWLGEWYPSGLWWEKAVLGIWEGSESVAKNKKGILGFCHSHGDYSDRVTGCYDGGSSGFYGDYKMAEAHCSTMDNIWREAGNIVQWHK